MKITTLVSKTKRDKIRNGHGLAVARKRVVSALADNRCVLKRSVHRIDGLVLERFAVIRGVHSGRPGGHEDLAVKDGDLRAEALLKAEETLLADQGRS